MLLEIPLRYMHSPVEMVSIKDIQRTGRLLAEFTAGLNGSFLNELSLDD
jgi:putative aminopeptidase FrvX